jgi:hypothetical protein
MRSKVLFKLKYYLLLFKNNLAKYNASVVVGNAAVVVLDPGANPTISEFTIATPAMYVLG